MISTKKGQCLEAGEAAQEERRRLRIKPKTLIISALLMIMSFALLHRPISHCYHRVSHHAHKSRSANERARVVLSKTPLIDGHVDLAVLIRVMYKNQIDNDDWKHKFANGPFPGDLDIKRLREGLSGGAFWSVYSPCPQNGTDLSDENEWKAVQFTYDQIDLTNRIHDLFPDDFSPSQGITVDTAISAFHQGKLISPIGVEGLHQIGNKVSNLRRFHAMGARYITLSHNCHNKFADAALEENPMRKATPLHNGVSLEGRKLINEMNRVGLIVDLSHTSEQTMVDILGGSEGWAGSKAPVMYSHSSAFAICPHPRNVPDHVLELVKARNSVVLVNIAPDFIACRDVGAENGLPITVPEESNLGRVVEHIMYIGELIGYDHVGIGTDLDGIPSRPTGFEDVTKYPDLVAELLRRGVSEIDAGKIVGGNILRVWRDVEKVAAKMQAAGEPALEDPDSYEHY
ncbi:unnamed protein product [Clonostachys chloroleuca]|uniref:Dipeptidase n=1 Tax=Clonostachys chloroleuca TaxID=1926264 RepID=A0AA35VK93_9HYPO|nr:unnamed protein product [Clonostachys chloroleuca]